MFLVFPSSPRGLFLTGFLVSSSLLPAGEPRVLNIDRTPEAITITWSSQPGHSYLIQSTSGLQGPWRNRIAHLAQSRLAKVRLPRDPKIKTELFRVAPLTISIDSEASTSPNKTTSTTTASPQANTPPSAPAPGKTKTGKKPNPGTIPRNHVFF